MKKYLLAVGLLLSGAGLTGSLTALSGATTTAAAAPTADEALAKQLVEKLWVDFKTPNATNLEALQKMMTANFQSLHEDGPRTGAEELKLIAGLKLSSYTLDKYKITRSGDVLVVTYQVEVAETIDATRLSKVAMPRMDVFQQIGGEWKWLAHANIRPLLDPTIRPLPIAPVK